MLVVNEVMEEIRYKRKICVVVKVDYVHDEKKLGFCIKWIN